jgi:hypothetical protein
LSTAAEESGEEKSKPVMTTTSSGNSNKSITTEIASASKQQSTEKSENNVVCDKDSEKHKKRVTFRATPETSDQCKVKHVYNPNYNGPLTSIIKKESLKYPILVYKSNCIVRPSRLTEIVKNTANNIDKLNSLKFGREYINQQASTTTVSEEVGEFGVKEQLSSSPSSSSSSTSNVIVASKFNLPKISTNSSRIIKPNKRFLDSPDECASTSKKKVIKASFWGRGGEDETTPLSSENKKTTSTTNSSNNSFGFNFVDELDIQSKKSKSKKDPKTSPTSSSILRKPVLQLSTTFGLFGSPQTNDGAIKSPFSLKLNSSSSSNISSSIFTTSLVCHVCNSITTRKQPRKYGAVCCDLCRKFMSRMIEKVNKNPACSFQCDKSDGELISNFLYYKIHNEFKSFLGNCSITPSTIKSHKSLRTQKLDFKVLSRDRCYACWLRKCLQNFQLPAPVKTRLNNVLPKLLAETKPLQLSTTESSNPFLSSLKFSSFKLSSNPLAVNNFTFGSKLDLKPAIDNALKTSFALDKPLQVEIPKESTDVLKKSPKSPSKPSTSPKKENPTSPSSQQTVAEAINPANVATSDVLRQRTLLKGPRVKHVCRSASLALGQPIAVFPGDKADSLETITAISDENIVEKENTAVVPEEKDNHVKENVENEGVNVQLQVVKRHAGGKPATRKVTRPHLSQNFDRISSTKPSKRVLFHQPRIINNNLPPMISIDFWENYDPAEVSRTGFGLILSEKSPIKSLCFLCGSCGSDSLIFCVCCCEPYHYYCVEDEFNIRFRVNNFLNESSDTLNNVSMSMNNELLSGYEMPLHKRLNWLCPRCTVCYTCNMSTGAKVKCQKCEKNYHTTCLGTSKRLLSADRPMICSSCLKCKSCGTTNVTKFIGNLPMCSNCFRLQRKGNFCPLCQKCYENNDYDVKMMECGDCRRWVHAKCEGLADEQYNLLSVLPEHIEFVCKKCSLNNSSANVWRDSVENEFKNSLLSVIKLLSKSRQACVLLRLSPRKKNYRCSCRMNSPSIGNSFNMLFDALKTEESAGGAIVESQCKCQTSQIDDLLKPSINSIKQNIQDGRYNSLQAFNFDMNKILADAQSEDLEITYNEIISEIFPWYQNETKACTDALEETMNDNGKGDLMDELMIESENGDFMIMPSGNLPDSIPKDEEIYQRTIFNGKDNRSCMLCKRESDFPSHEEGRLLYCGHNTWVHTNCALWSAEVYEEIDGSLQNVHSAISRGRMIKCSKCGLKGATVGCNFRNCGEQYHFQCARSCCEFGVDKRVFCPQHLSKIEDTRQLETNFEVNRSVYVELDRKKKKTIEASKVQFHIGSLCITKLGRIVPVLSDYGDFLVPIDFECTRLYWSSRQPWNIVEYKIKISIQRSNLHPLMMDKGINFTVDHSKADQMIQNKLKKISMFHHSILKEQEMMIVHEETQDEEPQNNNDLFPPEIKQAIFEDLPHDVLDGISMFDIFPKDSADSKAAFYNHVLDEDDDNSKSNQVNGDDDLNGFLNEFADDLNFSRKVQENPENKKRKLQASSTNINDSNNNQGSKNGERSSTSKVTLTKDSKIPQLDGLNDEIFDGPVAVHCERCRCTYRNRTSFDRHLSTCENLQNSNESDSDHQDGGNQVFHMKTTTSQQSITGLGGNNVISMINQQQNQSMATSIPIVINPFGQTTTTTLQNGGGAVQIPNLQLSIGNDGNICQNVIVDQQGQQIYAQPIQIGNFGQQATIMPLRNFNQATNVINNGNISYINASQQQPTTQYIQLAPSNGNHPQMMTIQSIDQQDQQKISNKKPLLLPSPTKGKGKTSMSGMQMVKSTAGTIVNGKKKMETMSTKTQQQISIVNSKNIQIANYQSSTASTNNTQIQQPSSQNIIFQQPSQQNYPLIINQNGQIIQCISADNQSGMSGSQIQYIGSSSKDVKNSSQTFITNQQNSAPQIFSPNSFQMQSNNTTGNLVLTPNGQLSVLPVQSPIVGTIIQQPQALQCVNGVMSAEQMMLGSTPALEMDPTSGCMYLTTQPVYYGLETIVQNTVMSSQQFVSTAAMQGICHQNSSFSATTTQVFQASKIEPIQMDIPTGYVFLNANDGTIQHQPQILDSGTTWNIVEDKKSSEINNFGSQKSQNVVMKTPTSANAKQRVQPKINKIQPQIINKIVPTTSSQQSQQVLKTINENPQQNTQMINTNNVIPKKAQKQANYRTIGPKIQQEDIVKSPPPPSTAAYIKPKVQAKPIVMNNKINANNLTVKSAEVVQKTVSIDQAYRTVQNNIISKPKNENSSNQPTMQTTVINLPPTNIVSPIFKQNSSKSSFQNRPTNRVLPMQAASGVKTNKIGNVVKGNGTTGSAGSNNLSSISPPLVNTSQNIHHSSNHNNNNNNNSVMPAIQNEISENYCEKIKSIAMELQSSKADELFDALRRSSTVNNVITVTPHDYFVEKVSEKKMTPSPPRIDDFQMPSTSSPSNMSIKSPTITTTKTATECSLTKTINSVATGENLIESINTIDIQPAITITPVEKKIDTLETILAELPELKPSKEEDNDGIRAGDDRNEEDKSTEKTFQPFDEDTSSDQPSMSSNSAFATKSSREKTPTSSSSSKTSGPKILIEIQSQDGFTYKSTSISEVWEKLFETVQLARKAHGLMPLPEGRLNEMTGDQMLGLKTNPLKYLLEQLPGVEKCARYSPKYHRRNSSASSTSSVKN